MAPSVRFYYLDGRDPGARFSIWSAADIFCSLSDNIQETFGLTVVEAMAAGLPVLVSNWNGYRDSVEHGVDGLLVDTAIPPGPSADAAYRYVSGVDGYDHYIGGISQSCVVDLAQTAHWLARLADDEDLRRTLGAGGRRSAETKYDWSVILARYRELWREQAARLAPARVDGSKTASTTWKCYDPKRMFAAYPSGDWPPDVLITRGPHFLNSWDGLMKMPGIVINPNLLAGKADLKAIEAAFAKAHPLSIEELLQRFAAPKRDVVLRTLYWLVKVGLLQVATPSPGGALPRENGPAPRLSSTAASESGKVQQPESAPSASASPPGLPPT
jgi:hypothetical protein